MDITCRDCGTTHRLAVTKAQLDAYAAGALAQMAFPHLTADERELVISRICGACFDSIFA